MTKCPACGSADIHRSRSTSLVERGRKLFGTGRPHRCHACGWRGWGAATPHRPAPVVVAPWEGPEVDFASLDAGNAGGQAHRQDGPSPGTVSGSRSRRRPGMRGSAKPTIPADFNRRVQLALFVALLLVGLILVLRACSNGPRSTEPDMGPGGQAWLVADPACAPHLPVSLALIRSTMLVVE